MWELTWTESTRSAQVINIDCGHLLMRHFLIFSCLCWRGCRLMIRGADPETAAFKSAKQPVESGQGRKNNNNNNSQTLNSYPFQLSGWLASSRKAVVLLGRCECVCCCICVRHMKSTHASSEPSQDKWRLKAVTRRGSSARGGVCCRHRKRVRPETLDDLNSSVSMNDLSRDPESCSSPRLCSTL